MKKTAIEIRSLGPEEIPSASALADRVFAEFVAPLYSRQGVDTFRRFIAAETLAEQLRSSAMRAWGAFRGNELVGVLAARDTNHISLLFVDKSCHRQGVARALFSQFLGVCRTDPQINRLTVNSSPFAVETYRKLGFSATDAERIADGIRFTPMEYRIN